MLELSILADGITSAEDAEFWFEVSNVGGGAIARYEGCALGSSLEPVVLANYPRWSEPAGALCTRLLHAATRQDPDVRKSPVLPKFSILIRLVPFGRQPAQELERIEVTQTETGWAVSFVGGKGELSRGRDCRAVSVALRALVQRYWSSSHIRKVVPVAPKIYQDGRTPYIRIGELPEPAQSAFARNVARSSRPYLPGVRDAAFAWDWRDFLDGGR